MGQLAVDASPGRPDWKSWLYVDALSGKDGHGLWWWRGEIGGRPLAYQTPVRAPFWCGRGPDGWPLLAVALGGDPAPGVPPENPYYPPDPPIVHLLAGSTGQEVHTIMALSWPQTADLDGDGLSDIWGSVEGKLRAFVARCPRRGGLSASSSAPAISMETASATSWAMTSSRRLRCAPESREPLGSRPFGTRRALALENAS